MPNQKANSPAISSNRADVVREMDRATAPHCPICAPTLPPSTEVARDDSHNIVRCSVCKLVRIGEFHSQAEVSSIYTGNYGYNGELDWQKVYAPDELAQTKPYRNLYEAHLRVVHLAKHIGLDVRSSLRMHDIGCSEGFELFFGKREGWRVSGNDLSEGRREWGRKNLGVDFALAYFAAYEPEDLPLDIVIMRHVLEHIPDPASELAVIRNRLSKTGVAIIEVPNFRSPELRLKLLRQQMGMRKGLDFMSIAEHYWQFTPSTLARLLERRGFVVRKTITSSTFTNHSAPVRFLKDNTLNRMLLGTHLIVAAQKT